MTKAGARLPEDPHDAEERSLRLRYGLAFGGALLLHASTAFGLVYWEPPQPVAPPGEMVVTLSLEAANFSNAQEVEKSGMKDETMAQTPQPPTPPEEETKEKEVVEEVEPTPEPLVEEKTAEVPKAKEAEVIISPKEQKKEKKKVRPAPAIQSHAAASTAKPKADVAGLGASASPTELNAYAARVRSAVERNKKPPMSTVKGVAYIAFNITRSGGITGLRMARSSGVPELDSAARATIASAGFPPIPDALPAPLPFGVPVTFNQ
jgi:protein TonB